MNAKKTSKRIVAVVLTMIMAISCFVLPSVVNAAGETIVNIHYLRDDSAYGDWDVWAWADGLDGAGYAFTDNGDANGAVATITITESTPKMGFIIRKPDWSAKDPEPDRYLDLSSVVSGTVDVYCKSGAEEFTTDYSNAVQGLKIKTANATSKTNVEFSFTKTPDDGDVITAADFTIVSAGGQNISIADLEMTSADAGKITLGDELDYSKDYTISFRDSSMKLALPDYFSSEEFEAAYTYTGDDLGATIVDGSTQFRVWAPTAEKVELNIYAEGNGGKAEQTTEMQKDVNGTWLLVANGNLSGKYYTYNAYFDGKTNKDIVDPYARTVGVNGKRGMIIDLDTTDPDGWNNDARHTYENLTDMQIYEVHVRDFSVSANSGITNKGKYLAFTETGTTLNNEGVIPTGVDHLVDLGITSVHILPSYDYGSVDETKLDKAQYNWGYDPVNYNAPEGSYSTDPYHGEVRVNEYKQMVKGLHDAGLGVIMDVVYNHTYNTNYCFNQLVPGYFYRPNQNTSGCGNDVASERSMVSKFIVDSVKYWAEEYHLDGFRFDLMGILDVDTMNLVRAAVDEVDPSIIIYGEGWNMGSVPTKNVKMANYTNAALTPGIAYFSDTLRDTIKGSVFDAADKGFVNGNISNYKTLNGAVQYTKKWCPSPSQIINYADCHDNLTLWDKINSSNGDDSEADRIRQNNLAAAIVQTAQGIPFMMSGEEFLRTKTKADGTFEHNSYASPDSVNELDYSRIATYADVYDYYKGLIAFRKAHPALRMTTPDDVAANFVSMIDTTEKGIVAYSINGGVNGEKAEQIVVIYNPLSTDTTVTLPEGEWDVYVNDTTASADIVLNTVSGTVTVPRISAMVLVKGYTPELPFPEIEPKYGIVGSMTGWGAQDDYPMVDMYESVKAMFEMLGTAFNVDGEEINLDEMEELQKIKGIYMGTTDTLQPGDYEFKVRAYNDGTWSESYGAYEEKFDRTNNSQTNIKVTLTKPSVIEVILDTTGEDSEIWPIYYIVAAEDMTGEPEFVFTGKPGTESEMMKELLNAGGKPVEESSQPEQSQPEQSQPQQSQPEQSQPQQSQPEQSQPQQSQPSQTSQQTSNTTPVNTGDSSNAIAIFVIALAAAAISVFVARKSKAE